MKRNFTLVALLMGCISAHAQLVINEIMQSNIDCVMDELNDFPDSWVELYNTGTTAVNLNGYKIGLTDDASSAWQLPSMTIASHGYALIYCDKVGSGIHTNFRLDSGKGSSVYLFNSGSVVSKLENLAKQPSPNVAYGSKTDGGTEMGYQKTPTPGAANCGEICSKVLGNPVFDMTGRVFQGVNSMSYSVNISLPEDAPSGTEIRYTIDGSEPTETSTLYKSTFTAYYSKVIRAKLFHDGYVSPRSVAQSYIVFPRQMTLPVISIVGNSKYFNDNKIGILVDGSYNTSKKNYEYDWRRPINFEMFVSPDSDAVLNQLCETRVTGGATRSLSLKSMGFYANKRFGEKHFKYEFFPDQRPGKTKFTSFMIRNAGNDFDYLYMRDAMAQRSMAKYQDLDWQAWRPAVVYINGVYKGILNIRERSNEDNIYTNYDGLEDIDMYENAELKEGDDVNVTKFMAFYKEHGHTMAEYAEWMDVAEYANLMIMESYYNNVDFPGNNMVMWRPRTEDGKWRWLAKDVDFILALYNTEKYYYKYFDWLYTPSYDSNRNWGANSYDATRLFRRLMEDADFKTYFSDRYAIYMGDFLNYKNVWANVWEPMYNTIKTEYPSHRKLFNEWWPDYSSELSTAQTWMQYRTNYMYTYINSYYSVGTPEVMTVNSNWTDAQKDAVDIIFNDVKLSKSTFDGKFWQGHNVTLKGVSKDGVTNVTAWKVITTSSSGTTTQTIEGDTYTFTMPTCTKLVVEALTGNQAGIDNVTMDEDDNTIVEIFDLNGIRRQSLQRGINIVKMKDGTTKKIRY